MSDKIYSQLLGEKEVSTYILQLGLQFNKGLNIRDDEVNRGDWQIQIVLIRYYGLSDSYEQQKYQEGFWTEK